MALSRDQAFGATVKAIRQERGLSQEAAALAARIDRAYYGKVERGLKSPTLGTVWKFSDGLGIRPSELLARTERLLNE
jgi:transcriptional regulator with XRE-family HTH domain